MIAILYNIRSIHNVGSMFRTAEGFGVEKLYLCGITPTPMDRFGRADKRFAKVSLGAEKWLPWEHVADFDALSAQMHSEKRMIVGIEQDKRAIKMSAYRATPAERKRLAIIVGPEVEGLPEDVLTTCHKILEIPMVGKKESFNVSVAFGIAVYALTAKTLRH